MQQGKPQSAAWVRTSACVLSGLLLAASVQNLMDTLNRNAKGAGQLGDGLTGFVPCPDLGVSAQFRRSLIGSWSAESGAIQIQKTKEVACRLIRRRARYVLAALWGHSCISDR